MLEWFYMSVLGAFLEEFHRGGSTEQCEELLDDWEELAQQEAESIVNVLHISYLMYIIS